MTQAKLTLKDLPLKDSVINKLEKIIEERHGAYLFLEHYGVGKSTAINIIVNTIVKNNNYDKRDILYLNGSETTSIDVVRNDISNFLSIIGDKIIIIEEFEATSNETSGSSFQKALKEKITSTLNNKNKKVLWLFTTNNRTKINEAILSRCIQIEFEVDKKKLLLTLKKIKEENNIDISIDEIKNIINTNYPDVRKCIQLLKYKTDNDIKNMKKNILLLYNNKININDFITSSKSASLETIISIFNTIPENNFEKEDKLYLLIVANNVLRNKTIISKTIFLQYLYKMKKEREKLIKTIIM